MMQDMREGAPPDPGPLDAQGGGTKKTLPPTYLGGALLAMAALRLVLPGPVLIPVPWSLLGLILLADGIVLNMIADSAFQKARTTVKPFEESSALVTSGVFRLSRHPMYLGFALVLAGVAVLLGTLTPFLVIPVFIVLMDRNFIQVEERMLEERFGPAWTEYRRKVRRWI